MNITVNHFKCGTLLAMDNSARTSKSRLPKINRVSLRRFHRTSLVTTTARSLLAGYCSVFPLALGFSPFSPFSPATSSISRTTHTIQSSFNVRRFIQSSTPFSTSKSPSSTTMDAASNSNVPAATTNTSSIASASSKTKIGALSPRILETLDPCVVLMSDLVGQYAPLWEDKGGIYSLAQGVVYWEPPISCQEALMEALSPQSSSSSSSGSLGSSSNLMLHTYGPNQGIPQLVNALQTKLMKENGFSSMHNNNIMVTVGANQAYMNCILTCLNDSSKAVVFAPYYFNHVMAIQMCCGDSSLVVGPCTDEGIPNLEWLQERLEQGDIDMVTIVNPGNPTGVSLEKETTLQQVVDLCQRYSAWLILDCTYEYFTTPENHQPIATFPDASHVIHIFSFSKSFSLAGYRCGYLVLHPDHQELWNNMLKVQDTLPIGPPKISQIAALGALKAGPVWVQEQYATLESSRRAILQALEQLPKTMGGTGAMYVMGQLPPPVNTTDGSVRDDVEVCRQLVELYGVACIPGTFCGFPGWIRVCYGNLEPTICEQAAERLQMGLNTILNEESSK